MYAIWSLIYFSFVCLTWTLHGATTHDILHYFHKCLVLTTYKTIWFLPALWVGGSIVFLLETFTNPKIQLLTLIFLWITGIVMGPYSALITSQTYTTFHDSYIDIFFTFRNGVFFGSVYFYLGKLCLRASMKQNLKKYVFCFVVSYSLFFIEAVIMHHYIKGPDTDMAVFMLPSVFFLVTALSQIKLKTKSIYTRLRDQSVLIFCGQRIFLTALPAACPTFFAPIFELPQIFILISFSVTVMLFAYTMDTLSVKYKFLTYLR